MSSHLFPEMSAALLAAIPNATWLEYMPWVSGVYAEQVVLDADGYALVSDRPGWGYRFDMEKARRYAL